MVNSHNKILNILIHFLKLLIYFDTYELQNINIQKGGAAAAVKVAATAAKVAPAAVPKATDPKGETQKNLPGSKGVMGKMGKNMMKQAVNTPSSSSNKSSNDTGGKENEEKSKNSMLDAIKRKMQIITFFLDIIKSIIQMFAKYSLKFATMLLFAATFPIIPFFAVMAGMYGIIKYFMYKLRRL